ncbi:MAG: transposase [Pseudobdellovibrionaceae bacterium]
MATVINDDLQDRNIELTKPQRVALADLAASLLGAKSVNTSELANVLPRDVKGPETRYRFINRWLANSKIKPQNVMKGFVPEILKLLYSDKQTAVLIMDQTKISDGFECLMISVRAGERALPACWCVIQMEGSIGFNIQKQLLDRVTEMIPQGMEVLLAADRFYGTSNLIRYCQNLGWRYRIRLKGNLILREKGGEIQTKELSSMGIEKVDKAELSNSGVFTSIGILHEEGHEEPWIIAMDCKANTARVLDYGLRWSIEPMFSDFKSRGFRITQTQLQHADRIERLLLIVAIAYYWAVSTGMMEDNIQEQPSKKKQQGVSCPISKED